MSLPTSLPPSLPLLSRPFPSPPLRSRPLKLARGSVEALWAPPAGSGAELRPKSNLVHSRAVRKPLVAIILSILKCITCSEMWKAARDLSWGGVLTPRHPPPLLTPLQSTVRYMLCCIVLWKWNSQHLTQVKRNTILHFANGSTNVINSNNNNAIVAGRIVLCHLVSCPPIVHSSEGLRTWRLVLCCSVAVKRVKNFRKRVNCVSQCPAIVNPRTKLELVTEIVIPLKFMTFAYICPEMRISNQWSVKTSLVPDIHRANMKAHKHKIYLLIYHRVAKETPWMWLYKTPNC